jgi:hypothetical protein
VTETILPTEPGIYVTEGDAARGIGIGPVYLRRQYDWLVLWTETTTRPERRDDAAMARGIFPSTLVRLEAPAPSRHALPTTPGAYHDVDGDLWVLDSDGKWSYPIEPDSFINDPESYLPFTRLVPKVSE